MDMVQIEVRFPSLGEWSIKIEKMMHSTFGEHPCRCIMWSKPSEVQTADDITIHAICEEDETAIGSVLMEVGTTYVKTLLHLGIDPPVGFIPEKMISQPISDMYQGKGGMKRLDIYEFQAKHIENAFRLVARTLESQKKETSIDRDVMQGWEMIKNVLSRKIDKHVPRL